MPRTIRFLENPPLHPLGSDSPHYDGTVDFAKLEVGDMCFYHHRGVACCNHARLQKLNLTAHYFANNFPNRAPLILAMPDAASKSPRYFMVDGQCYSNKCTRCRQRCWDKCKCPGESTPMGYYDGWTVTGTPPLITVHPSVDFDEEDKKHYHGFVQNGVIGDG